MPTDPCRTQLENDREIGTRDVRTGAIGPFQQTHGTTVEILVQARIEKFIRITESIKIKVMK